MAESFACDIRLLDNDAIIDKLEDVYNGNRSRSLRLTLWSEFAEYLPDVGGKPNLYYHDIMLTNSISGLRRSHRRSVTFDNLQTLNNAAAPSYRRSECPTATEELNHFQCIVRPG